MRTLNCYVWIKASFTDKKKNKTKNERESFLGKKKKINLGLSFISMLEHFGHK